MMQSPCVLLCVVASCVLVIVRYSDATSCYNCASSLKSSVMSVSDKYQATCKKDGEVDNSPEPCCKDPFNTTQTSQIVKAGQAHQCDLCLKVKYLWDKRPKDETVFYRRLCYKTNDNAPFDALDDLLSSAVSRGSDTSAIRKVSDQKEEKEEREEMRRAILNDHECRKREMESPHGDIEMEICGCLGDWCNGGRGVGQSSVVVLLVAVVAVVISAGWY